MNKLSFLNTLVFILFCKRGVFAQSSVFTYQGHLTDSSWPPTGQYDFVFAVYQNLAAPTALASVNVDDVQVTKGIFTVDLDFGSTIFRDNPSAVLEIRVRPGASTDAYTTLVPRQPFASTPRALTSIHANTAVNADTIDGVDSTSFFSLGDNEIVTGIPSFNGGTSGATSPFTVDSNTLVSNLNADLLDGLTSTSFIQTTGGTMTGQLNLPANGLRVGTNQLITSDGRVSVGSSAAPVARLQVEESIPATMAVYGVNTSTGGGDGVGVRGVSVNGTGAGFGGYFTGGSIGAYGYANAFSHSGNAFGVYAGAQGTAGTRYGIYADAVVFPGTQTAYGVYGVASGATTNFAGYFQGNTHVTGILSKGGGAFKIDHPLDPTNKYLQHSFVESPEMMNIYNGNVVTDANGNAVITLPEWFEALNKDFRYQLTVIGQFAQAIVSEKIRDNRFAVKTDKPEVEVSWQVTGVRKDKFAEDNRIKVVEDKLPADRGKCLHAPLCGGVKLDPGEDAKKENDVRKLKQ